jgi:hypothetical protein
MRSGLSRKPGNQKKRGNSEARKPGSGKPNPKPPFAHARSYNAWNHVMPIDVATSVSEWNFSHYEDRIDSWLPGF